MADISIPIAERIVPLGKPKRPIEKPVAYRGKSPDESAHRCDVCTAVLVWVTHEITGPMSLSLCKDLEVAEPKRSNKFPATLFGLAWFFAVPDPVHDDKWYRVITKGTCPSCRERRWEKDRRRGFSKFRLVVLWAQSKCKLIECANIEGRPWRFEDLFGWRFKDLFK